MGGESSPDLTWLLLMLFEQRNDKITYFFGNGLCVYLLLFYLIFSFIVIVFNISKQTLNFLSELKHQLTVCYNFVNVDTVFDFAAKLARNLNSKSLFWVRKNLFY